MALFALVRRCRSLAPLAAFIATAVLAIVLAAQAQLVCGHALHVEMAAAMPGMDMSGTATAAAPATLALCPVVLILGIAAALLALNAFTLIAFDPHRTTTARILARRCARLPLAGTAATVVACGSIAVGIMMTIDRSTPAGPAGWLTLAGVIAAIAVATAVIAIVTARCGLAFTRRLAVALAAVIERFVPTPPVPAYARLSRAGRTAHRVPLLAARRGLRAPPFHDR